MTDKPEIRGTIIMSNRGPVASQPGRSGVLMLGVVSMPTEQAELFASLGWDHRLVTGSSLVGMGEFLNFAVQRDPVPLMIDGEEATWLRNARVDQLVTSSGLWRI